MGFRRRPLEDVVVTPSFWRGRRVFLTGHTGFKGAWLALWLHKLGAEVSGYALLPPTQPSLFEGARISELVTSIMADIRDLPRLTAALRDANPELVFHLAAQALVRRSYADPIETFSSNLMGTVNLLDAMRSCPSVRAAVVVTSDKCYENRGLERGYVETDPLGGFDPYSSSKACAEIATAAYRRSFFGDGPAVATARAGNVIGGGDWAIDRLVPDAVRAYCSGQPVRLRYPYATRPWQHVLDPLAGYLLLAEKLLEGEVCAEAWNFGPADDHVAPVAQVVEALARKWGRDRAWEQDSGRHPHEAQLLGLDAGKAHTRLGWAPHLDMAQTIDWTAEWYLAWHDGADMRQVSELQLDRYRNLAKS